MIFPILLLGEIFSRKRRFKIVLATVHRSLTPAPPATSASRTLALLVTNQTGGGKVLVPVLTLLFDVDIRYAIGASLMSVIATSLRAAAYVKESFTNIRIDIFLEVATTIEALIGAGLAARLSTSLIAVVFGSVLLYSAYSSSQPKLDCPTDEPPDLICGSVLSSYFCFSHRGISSTNAEAFARIKLW